MFQQTPAYVSTNPRVVLVETFDVTTIITLFRRSDLLHVIGEVYLNDNVNYCRKCQHTNLKLSRTNQEDFIAKIKIGVSTNPSFPYTL